MNKMIIQENAPLGPKTTLKIGGSARYYAELETKEDLAEASQFAKEKNVPLVVLGAGSNTIFADGMIDAIVVKIVADNVNVDSNIVTVAAGKNLAQLINELAEQGLDLSPLTGIPGTVGGAIVGNAGQGFEGIWIGEYVESVEIMENKEWRIKNKEECEFEYRTSTFKKMKNAIIWSATLVVPSRNKEEIQSDIESLLKKRIESQPHKNTAGSCFLSPDKETPAWKLIDAAGLRGKKIGGIQVSEKHSNFLENTGNATFEDAKKLVEEIKSKIDQPLPVEMRLIDKNGHSL